MRVLYEYFFKPMVNGVAIVDASNDPLHFMKPEPAHRLGIAEGDSMQPGSGLGNSRAVE